MNKPKINPRVLKALKENGLEDATDAALKEMLIISEKHLKHNMNFDSYPQTWREELYFYTATYCASYGKLSIRQHLDQLDCCLSAGRKWVNLTAVNSLIFKAMTNDLSEDHWFIQKSFEYQYAIINLTYQLLRNQFSHEILAARKGVDRRTVAMLALNPEITWVKQHLNHLANNPLKLRYQMLGEL